VKDRVAFQPLRDDLCFEILCIIEEQDDLRGLLVCFCDHLKVFNDTIGVTVFFPRYVVESMGIGIVGSKNIEPLPSSVGFENGRAFGISPT